MNAHTTDTSVWLTLLTQAMHRESAARGVGDLVAVRRHARIRTALLAGAQRTRARAHLLCAGYGALLLDSPSVVIDGVARVLGEQGGDLAGALVVLSDELSNTPCR